jgi:hypothetical protein
VIFGMSTGALHSLKGLAGYRNLSYVNPIINDEGKQYFWRLERLAELVLKAVALKNEDEHKTRS